MMKSQHDRNLLKQRQYLGFEKTVAEESDFADFGRALVYPFKYKKSLILAATALTILSLGQSLSTLGNSTFIISIVCLALAGAILFVCLANTTKNFSQGIKDCSFVPTFEKHGLRENIVRPILLSLAVYFISFGLLIVLSIGAIWYAFDAESKIEANKQKIISVVLPKQPTNFEKSIENENVTVNQTIGTILRLSLVFSVPMFLALLWGTFYFPAACVSAVRTGSVSAVLNLSAGFDTVKRLGFDYWKIVAVFSVLIASSFGLNAILQFVFSSLNLPLIGNLPAKFVSCLFVFYLSIVFSVALGTMLFNNSKKLNFRYR